MIQITEYQKYLTKLKQYINSNKDITNLQVSIKLPEDWFYEGKYILLDKSALQVPFEEADPNRKASTINIGLFNHRIILSEESKSYLEQIKSYRYLLQVKIRMRIIFFLVVYCEEI